MHAKSNILTALRYPRQFQYDHNTDIFENNILQTSSRSKSLDPWVFLLQNIPEDFVLAQRCPESSQYIMSGGIALSALGWNISMKIGKTLREIHEPVPDYKDKLAFSIDRYPRCSQLLHHVELICRTGRYFDKLPVDKPIQRGSWDLEIGQPLFLLPSDPHFDARNQQSPDIRLSDIHLRVDWQTLRRLPQHSDVIVFNYKALFTPIKSFRDEPYIPGLLLKVLSGAKEPLMKYKGT